MSRLYIFLKIKKYSTQGLTLVEVIVGMLISALFLSTALQAYVSAVSIKAKAQHADVVITTIHSDVENIRQMALADVNADDCKGNPGRKIIEKLNIEDNQQINGISNPESQSISPIVEAQNGQLIEQTTTLPLIAGSDEYQFRRVLSTDDDDATNPSHLLHVFYQVIDRSSDAQVGDDKAVNAKTVAQLRTSVMPNAVLVCP